jgi:hypothetical protein
MKALRREARQRIKEANIARKVAHAIPEVRDTVKKMEGEAAGALAEADNLRLRIWE